MNSSAIDAARPFFAFMEKREEIRLKKEQGLPWPWSNDAILNEYKFTNVKREHDRTTRWMRKNWTAPNSDAPAEEIIFNCALFRYFGTISFAEHIGWQKNWNPHRVIKAAEGQLAAGLRIFTGAYIIPTLGFSGPKHTVVCNSILTPLWKERGKLAALAATTKSWRSVAEALMRLPGFGGTGFMAKEVLQDTIHTRVLNSVVDRNTWCPAGPGAQRGLNRVHSREVAKRVKPDQALEEMVTLFNAARSVLPTWMPELELHDIQFQLCEFDKYERARLGEGRPKAKYRRYAY